MDMVIVRRAGRKESAARLMNFGLHSRKISMKKGAADIGRNSLGDFSVINLSSIAFPTNKKGRLNAQLCKWEKSPYKEKWRLRK